MNKFGPSRGEHKFRLAVSVAGLALMISAMFYRGFPAGPAMAEVAGFAGMFFGGSAVWSGWQLLRNR